jgi:hypothetical protein
VSVDRGAWKLYAGAALVALSSLVLLGLGNWPSAIMGLSTAALIAVHPYLRRTWYLIGYAQGYMDAQQHAPLWRPDE